MEKELEEYKRGEVDRIEKSVTKRTGEYRSKSENSKPTISGK